MKTVNMILIILCIIYLIHIHFEMEEEARYKCFEGITD